MQRDLHLRIFAGYFLHVFNLKVWLMKKNAQQHRNMFPDLHRPKYATVQMYLCGYNISYAHIYV